MLVAKFENQSNAATYVFFSCMRGLWGEKSLHGNIVMRVLGSNDTPGKITDVLEMVRRQIIERHHPRTEADMGLIQYAGDMAGFHMWSEEPTDHIRVACDLHTVTIDVAAGTEDQLREILAQSGTSAWEYMATSGAVTEGSIDELVAMEMAAQLNDAFARR